MGIASYLDEVINYHDCVMGVFERPKRHANAAFACVRNPNAVPRIPTSICLDSSIYPPHKRIRRQKAHGTRQQPIHRTSQQAVTEEKETGYESVDIKFGVVEDDAVKEDPEGATTADEDGLPPPIVVLCHG